MEETMLRVELDQIQTQLKSAILNHQILVSRLQLQPQETGLKAQLHNLQKEIINMCKKQKLVVEKLGKDIIEKPNNALKSAQVVNGPDSQPRADATNHSPLPIVSKSQDLAQPQSCYSPQCLPDQPAAQPNQCSGLKPGTPSPIRVPCYSANRTAVLQNNNFITKDESIILNRISPTEGSKTLNSSNGPDRQKLEEQKQLKKKLSFMASLDLVPPDTLKDVPCKRSERKRKSTNNPNFAYGFELEKRPRLSNFLASDYFGAKKSKAANQTLPSDSSVSISTTDQTSTPIKHGKENVEENVCSICGRNGQLLMCDKCSCLYHLQCLNPPLECVPQGQWICSKCLEAQRKSTSLAAVNAYISNKTGTLYLRWSAINSECRCCYCSAIEQCSGEVEKRKEEEKRKLLKRSTELLQEKQHIENRTKQINELLTKQELQKKELIQINRNAQQSVEKLRKFVELVQSS